MASLLLVVPCFGLATNPTLGMYQPFPFPSPIPLHSVVHDPASPSGLKLVEGRPPRGVSAWGSFVTGSATTGTSVMSVNSNESLSGVDQSFAAGYLEAALTWKEIWNHFQNVWHIDFAVNTSVPNVPHAEYMFVEQNLAWMETQYSKHRSDPYWQQIIFLLSQLEGMVGAFNEHAHTGVPRLSRTQFLMLTLVDGDMVGCAVC